MTTATTLTKWIENAINFFGELAEKSTNFMETYETNGYSGKGFVERIDNTGSQGFYRWAAVNIKNSLVIFYTSNNVQYYKSRYQEDPPCYRFTLSECKSEELSKSDKESLTKIFDEICQKIHGMNSTLAKTLAQVEKEFEIELDTENMFAGVDKSNG